MVFWVVAAASSAAKADVFVAPTGSDRADGRTALTAVSTLARASALAERELATEDCSIQLEPGDYSGSIIISAGEKRLSIVGTRGRPGSPLLASTLLDGPLVFKGRPVLLVDLVIESPNTPTAPHQPGQSAIDTLLEISGSKGSAITGCLFTGSADTAVRLKDCRNWRIDNCIFYDIYRCLFAVGSTSGQLVNNTLVDDRMGHGTNSLTTGRLEFRDGCDHLAIFNNAFSPRDPDGKVMLIDACGDDIQSDYNIWRGVITHQYGTEQQSTWQNNFRTLDSWQTYTAEHWGKARDLHSRSEPLTYTHAQKAAGVHPRLRDESDVPQLVESARGQYGGAGMAVESLGSVEAPTTDFYGNARGNDIGAVALPKNAPATTGRRSFTIAFPSAGRASVGIFDTGGRQIRTLVGGQLFTSGPHTFQWDGDDNDAVAVTEKGPLEYRAVLTPDGPLSLDIAGAGCSWVHSEGTTDLANNPQENGEGMWCDKQGNLYRVAPYDEAGSTILSTGKDGHYRWRNWVHNGTLVTGDDNFIYVLGCDKHDKNQVGLERFPLAGTGPKAWDDVHDSLSLGLSSEITPTGLATAGGKLYVSDGPHDRVLVYTVGSPNIEKTIEVPRPAGLVAGADGGLIVCSRKSRAAVGSVFIRDADGHSSARIDEGIDDPVDVAVGSQGAVFIADAGAANQVLRLDRRTLAISRLGAANGYQHDSVVNPDRMIRINHIAASGSSLWVGQKEPGYARNRLVRYDLPARQDAAPALEILSLEGQNGSCADPLDPSHIYSADLFRYAVDLDTGKWNWDRNYSAARWSTVKEQVGCSTASVFYVGGKRFFAATICNSPTSTSRTVLVFRFDGEQLVPCAAVGGKYFGPSFQDKNFDSQKSGKWVWLDKNGDGKLTTDEVQFVQGQQKDGMPFPDCAWGTYIERDGTIVWPGNDMHYLRPHGLDPTGTIPVYDWADAVTVKYLDFPERDERYEGRVDTDGCIYDLSTTKHERMPPGYWGMGTVLTKLDPAGHRQFSVPLSLTAKGITVDDHFVYVGSCFGPFINQYTKDGLLVRTFSWGHTGSQFGWFDFPTPINSVSDPKTGDSILTAEEQWFGRIMVFRVPGVVQRFTGAIAK